MTFTPEEKIRYSRQVVLPAFGEAGQIRLKQARVAVVGAGGLGCAVLPYLAAAGVGTIGIIDGDSVSLSNLQRQVLFTEADLQQPKATCAATRIRLLNSSIDVVAYPVALTAANALEILQPYDCVVDATDRFPARYLINDACVLLQKPFVYGAIHQYEGQVAVFHVQGGATYRDLFPTPPPAELVPTCETGGVLGALAGVIGSIQAMEAICLMAGLTPGLAGRLLVLDGRTYEQHIVKIPQRNQKEGITNLIDYDFFCSSKTESRMKEVNVKELKEMMDTHADFQLIDVREPHEYDICNLEGELIPLAQVPHQLNQIARDKKVVVHCRSGGRSGNIIQWLEKNHGFTNLYNLKGGILAWADEIDPSVTKY
jgi:molybdopterin/thiamine biosynthesis adenylyltransferase/rhodanese-related sulfurtransferase